MNQCLNPDLEPRFRYNSPIKINVKTGRRRTGITGVFSIIDKQRDHMSKTTIPDKGSRRFAWVLGAVLPDNRGSLRCARTTCPETARPRMT